MNEEDIEFMKSLNCWEDNYDVITDNIQKLSGLLSTQIRNFVELNIEKEHKRNSRYMTEEEVNIKRMLNNFEQSISIKLAQLLESQDRLCKLLEDKQISKDIDTKEVSEVYKQQVESGIFVKVGSLRDNILILNEPTHEFYITKPSHYFVDWFVKNNTIEIACEWLDVYPSNSINEILVKSSYTNNVVATGYLTEDGTAIYYDQYL